MKHNKEQKADSGFVSKGIAKPPVMRSCPVCSSQNLATIKTGFFALGVYFPSKIKDKMCLSCNHEFYSA